MLVDERTDERTDERALWLSYSDRSVLRVLVVLKRCRRGPLLGTWSSRAVVLWISRFVKSWLVTVTSAMLSMIGTLLRQKGTTTYMAAVGG